MTSEKPCDVRKKDEKCGDRRPPPRSRVRYVYYPNMWFYSYPRGRMIFFPFLGFFIFMFFVTFFYFDVFFIFFMIFGIVALIIFAIVLSNYLEEKGES